MREEYERMTKVFEQAIVEVEQIRALAAVISDSVYNHANGDHNVRFSVEVIGDLAKRLQDSITELEPLEDMAEVQQ